MGAAPGKSPDPHAAPGPGSVDARLGRWPVTFEQAVAWGEMDALGHVNNVAYLRWFESARIAYFDAVERRLPHGLIAEHQGVLLARQEIDYKRPVVYPARVAVRITVTRLGRSSITMAFDMRLLEEGRANAPSAVTPQAVADAPQVAVGQGVLVMADYKTGRSIPLEPRLVETVVALEATGPGPVPRGRG